MKLIHEIILILKGISLHEIARRMRAKKYALIPLETRRKHFTEGFCEEAVSFWKEEPSAYFADQPH